ncbi:MAG: PIN domain-containing protein [Promicromonosporaceae bacterium]|nr:PIN domain-containing protein [Promicromonosporaceae bacterium]
MVSVLLDTNVVIDYLAENRPGHGDAVALVRVLVLGGIGLHIAATSLKDVYYIVTRTHGEVLARQAISCLSADMTVIAIDAELCARALASNEPDFEDGLIRECAIASGAQWIVTRDVKAFLHSPVPTITPRQLLDRLG